MKDFKKFYEWYHRDRRIPKRIIAKHNYTYRHIIEILDRFCKSKDVLDIGSGVGTIDFYLASMGKKVTGIEISDEGMKAALISRDIFDMENEVTFHRKDFYDYKPKIKFNFVICSEVLEHLRDDKRALKKIYDLTYKGGLAMITVPSKNAPLIRLGSIKQFDKISGHLRRYTVESLSAMMKNNGFKIVHTSKHEGIFRNSLYVYKLLQPLIRVANKFKAVSDIFSFIDIPLLHLFGESQVVVIGKK